MQNYSELKKALEDLLSINEKGTKPLNINIYDDSTQRHLINTRKPTIKDYQELNYQATVRVCDLLGMSNLYLNHNK